jgi:predicted dehydrogenase
MKRTVKVGIIGCGGIGGQHLKMYAQTEGVEVVACADVVEDAVRRRAEEFHIPNVFTDYNKLLAMEEIEVVSVCTPHVAHAPATTTALKAGKHVLCEKPMAATAKDGAEMVRAWRQSGKILQIGLHTRFSSENVQAKKFIEAGDLGDIYFAEFVGTRRRGIAPSTFTLKATAHGGAVLDIGVYQIDTALNLMGHPTPVSVSAITQDYIGKRQEYVAPGSWKWDPDEFEVEEFGAAFIRFANGAALNIKTSWAVHLDSMGSSFILGTRGGLSFNPLTLYHDRYGVMVNTVVQHLPNVDIWKAEFDAFLNAIRNDLPSPVPPDGVLLTNVIIDGIYESAKKGHEVKVTVPQIS